MTIATLAEMRHAGSCRRSALLASSTSTGVQRLSVLYIGTFSVCRPTSANAVLPLYSSVSMSSAGERSLCNDQGCMRPASCSGSMTATVATICRQSTKSATGNRCIVALLTKFMPIATHAYSAADAAAVAACERPPPACALLLGEPASSAPVSHRSARGAFSWPRSTSESLEDSVREAMALT